MRRIVLLIVVLCISVLFYLQYGREPYVNQVLTNSHPNGYEMTLYVTVNQLFIVNKENLANQLIHQVTNNAFQNILFSYDVLGYPNALTLVVYANESAKNTNSPTFTVYYTQEVPYKYNIKENPEKFSLRLE